MRKDIKGILEPGDIGKWTGKEWLGILDDAEKEILKNPAFMTENKRRNINDIINETSIVLLMKKLTNIIEITPDMDLGAYSPFQIEKLNYEKKIYDSHFWGIPRNQIWYTSSDGSTITPYSFLVFGANIVSNTYENGVGIITFDADVTYIGNYAFRGCTSLTSITIPEGVTKISGTAFYKCTSLTSITIPDSVTLIDGSAFRDCSYLASVTIGNGVTEIGEGAFYNCSNLKTVYCKATTPPTGGTSMFF